MKKRQYKWFLHTNDARTNDIIGRQLDEATEFRQFEPCEDGVRRHLWECSHELVTQFIRSKAQFAMSFDVYVQEGPRGKIRLWEFPKKKPAGVAELKAQFGGKVK